MTQRTGLYCYWGALGDHNVDAPGHPLYQIYCLEFLAKKFNLDKIYFCSLFKDKIEKTADDTKFYINGEQRSQIMKDLKIEIVTFGQAVDLLNTTDEVFLKARFRNKSRLQERSFDALKFEVLLDRAPKDNTYVVDSDGELPVDFFEKNDVNLLTYFLDHDFYQRYTAAPKSIQTIAPALVASFDLSPTIRPAGEYDMFFIGNEGLKQPALSGWLDQLSHDGMKVGVQGKWSPKFSFDVFQRFDRETAYPKFASALSTLQISKEKYREFTFLSPRLYEAGVCGVIPFIEAGYKCSSSFCSVANYIEFREKVKGLREGYSRDYKAIRDEQAGVLQSIEDKLLAASPTKLKAGKAR